MLYFGPVTTVDVSPVDLKSAHFNNNEAFMLNKYLVHINMCVRV